MIWVVVGGALSAVVLTTGTSVVDGTGGAAATEVVDCAVVIDLLHC